jgi:hypothetical protein
MARASISRRAAFGVAAGAASAAGSPAIAEPAARKTYVLVHGAYHGGWCWRRVADILEGHGHKVFAESLTGLGDRSHLLSKEVVLDTHIADIVNLMTWEDLHDVCLVVHSYGGYPGSGALEHIHDRVAAIVWLDAFKPKDGQKEIDYASAFNRQGIIGALAKGEPGTSPPPARNFSLSEKDYAWLDSKMTPHPTGTATQPIRLTGKIETIARKTYIRASKYLQPAFDNALAECRADRSWRTIVNDTSGHDVMVDEPEWLAATLMKVS